jgi:hypothetical protein
VSTSFARSMDDDLVILNFQFDFVLKLGLLKNNFGYSYAL